MKYDKFYCESKTLLIDNRDGCVHKHYWQFLKDRNPITY